MLVVLLFCFLSVFGTLGCVGSTTFCCLEVRKLGGQRLFGEASCIYLFLVDLPIAFWRYSVDIVLIWRVLIAGSSLLF